MGTHENGPSYIITDELNLKGEKLEEFLFKKNLSDKGLPFLFKVLSVEDPLSIQAHPNKKLAEILHEKRPSIYKDPNHKPEMAIVISDKFYLLYGFLPTRNAKALCEFLLRYKIFGISTQDNKDSNFESLMLLFISENDEKKNYQQYKVLLTELLNIPKEDIFVFLEKFNKLIISEKSEIDKGYFQKDKIDKFILDKLILVNNLYDKFSLDIGIMFSLFMNYFETKYGDAIFIGANIPHAYIYGDCMECMANSDNVIRLGLTPKFIDKPIFEEIIITNFDELISDEYKFSGKQINNFRIEYAKEGISDFKLNYFKMEKYKETEFFNENNSVLIAIKGKLKVTVNNESNFIVESFIPFFIEEKINLKIDSIDDTDISEFYIATN